MEEDSVKIRGQLPGWNRRTSPDPMSTIVSRGQNDLTVQISTKMYFRKGVPSKDLMREHFLY